MYSYVTDDRMGRYFRRYQLGLRFLAHDARSQTTAEWCGLTKDQLVTLRRRWRFGPDGRRRGPAPSSLQVFFRSRLHRNQAAVFASLCRILCERPGHDSGSAPEPFVCLENGEMLCEALEAYREWQPDATMDFEYALLLAKATMQESSVALSQCSDCHKAILIEQVGRRRTTCTHCRRGRSAQQRSEHSVIHNQKDEEAERDSHHPAERESRTGRRNLEDDRGHNADHAQRRAEPINDRSEE